MARVTSRDLLHAVVFVTMLVLAAAGQVPPAWVPRINAAQMMFAPTDVGVKYMCVARLAAHARWP